MNKKQNASVNLGTSLLLCVFLILVLVSFAILGLTTARSSLSFATKQADHTREYYEACNLAEEAVANMTGTSPQEFSFRVNDAQTLEVSVEINQNKKEVTRWQVVSDDNWNPAETYQIIPEE